VRWFSTPAFLGCIRGAHDRGEGANVREGMRTAEVWARTAEGGGGTHGSAEGVHGRGARTAWGGAYGRGRARLRKARTARGMHGLGGRARQGAHRAPGSGGREGGLGGLLLHHFFWFLLCMIG
jgi:hypothetical protein